MRHLNLTTLRVPTRTSCELFALKYAERAAMRAEHFIGGDPHDAPMPMAYYIWLARSPRRTFVIDVGFAADVAARRGRAYLRRPIDALALLDVDAARVEDVIVTHMHYDHVGTFGDFPSARFHLQDDEMSFATGRHMRDGFFSSAYEVDDVVGMVRLVFKDRVVFHDGVAVLAPGLSVHRIGGHTKGLQCVRVRTRRGWVVLASDASHYYEHMQSHRSFPIVFNVGELIDGYRELARLADSPDHIIPGHDPLVMSRYSAPAAALHDIVARLDDPPKA